MRSWVVYESMWGNTEQVARAVARGLERAGDVTLFEVNGAPAAPTPDVALVVAGGPTHAFSMTRPRTRAEAIRQGAPEHGSIGLREWLTALPDGRHGPRLVTFDTRVAKVRNLPGSAAKVAARTARRHHYVLGDVPQSFWVVDSAGPLLDGELDRAQAWGLQLGELLGEVTGGAVRR